MTSPLLQIKQLDVTFQQGEKFTDAVKTVSLDVHHGETVALIGESGSGKSVTALSVLQLLPYPTAQHSQNSSIRFDELELINASEKKIRDIRAKKKFKRYRIQEVIKPGQIILLQIVKEERGKKGAALTTFLSLAGKYIVLMPNTAKGGGISRKIFNSQDRRNIRGIIKELTIPETMGLIVRTAGAKKTQNEIKNDLDVLIQIWEEIKEKTLTSNAPSLIHEEGDVIYRTIRDFFSNDIKEVIVDGPKGFDKAKKYAEIINQLF